MTVAYRIFDLHQAGDGSHDLSNCFLEPRVMYPIGQSRSLRTESYEPWFETLMKRTYGVYIFALRILMHL